MVGGEQCTVPGGEVPDQMIKNEAGSQIYCSSNYITQQVYRKISIDNHIFSAITSQNCTRITHNNNNIVEYALRL